MRAAYYENNGPANEVLKLGEIETPQPGPGEVRVKLAASGVNPSDVKSRKGMRKIAFPRVIPHSDGAGVIDAIGEGVSPTRIGERVWTWNGQWKRAFGTCAEAIVLPEMMAVPLPDHVGFAEGACLGIPAMTAAHAVAVTGPDARTIFISGGAGAVSHYAIQFAKARGATVITTISSDAKADLARKVGADHVINYKSEDVGARVREIFADGVDAILELDITANAKLIPSVLRPRGKVVVYGTGAAEATIPSQMLLVNAVTLQYIFVYELTRPEREAAIGLIMQEMEAKRLIHNIAKTFSLDEIIAAHDAIESGKAMGNIVVKL